MFFLIKLFLLLMALPVLLAFAFGISLFFRIRRNLENPLARGHMPHEKPGKIIEGEYRVLEEKDQ